MALWAWLADRGYAHCHPPYVNQSRCSVTAWVASRSCGLACPSFYFAPANSDHPYCSCHRQSPPESPRSCQYYRTTRLKCHALLSRFHTLSFAIYAEVEQ